MCHPVRNLILTACVLVLLAEVPLASAAPAAASEQAANLLPNPSFEEQSDGQPAGWKTQTWGGEGTFAYADTGRTGKRSLMISSEKGADVGWAAVVKVEPNSTYRLSAWIKTEDLRAPGARGALLNLHDLQPVATNAVTGTKDWTKVEAVFDTDGVDQVQVNCLFGGWGLATGKAWYDDVRLEKLATQALEPKIAIDARQTGEPISKYIYGQFIEHLGRCIYGGIWAEMLEDRKFSFPITAKYNPYRFPRGVDRSVAIPVVASSPWEIIGQADSVTMVKENAFVGEQTPLIAPGGGIRQRELGLVKSKEYVGYVWLKPAGETTTVQVSLRWGEGPELGRQSRINNASNRYRNYPLRFTSGADTDKGILEIRVTDGGPCLVGTVSLMPADNVEGMRADTLAVLKQLDAPVYRWPGGNFVSGYNWKDGIGPRDRRPPRKNPAWTGVEHNDFGLDEFMTYCRLLGTDPLVVVNSGEGQAASAVEELQYANGGADTPMGKLRAQNGHSEPYKVKWWGVGNEMYGNWQLGHMPLEKYIQKHNQFAEAMKAEDPSIKLIAVGAVGTWSEGMMQHSADHMDLISEHFYVQERPGLAAHVRQCPDRVRAIAQAHRRYRQQFDSLKGKDIRIALDEWNHWYGPHVFGELGTRYFLKDGLGIAAGLNEFARNSDLYFMANYAQTVNVIGCIKTTKTAAALESTGLALMLYRRHFGVLPVKVTTNPPLDVAAAWTGDRKTLTVAVVNPSMNKLEIPLTVEGAKLSGAGRSWQMAGDDPMAYNQPGQDPKVTIEETALTGVSDKLSVAPCSVTLFALGVE
jgi:alpha-N-arabinofuranosidase